MLVYGRNQHNIVKQISCNKKFILKKLPDLEHYLLILDWAGVLTAHVHISIHGFFFFPVLLYLMLWTDQKYQYPNMVLP